MADNDVKPVAPAPVKAAVPATPKPDAARAEPAKAPAAPPKAAAPQPVAAKVEPAKPQPAAAAPAKVEPPKVVAAPAPVAKPAPVAAKAPAVAPAKPIVSKPVAKKPAPTAAKAPAPRAKPVAASKPAVPTSVAAPAVKESIMDKTTETITNKAQAFFAGTTDRTKGAVEKGQQFFADANEFAKGNVEAMIESSKIAAKGAEDIARYSTDYARQTVAQANENARKFASVKSPTEFFQLQSEITRGTVDALATETAKFTENYLKLLGDVVQPLSNRFALAAEKVKTAA